MSRAMMNLLGLVLVVSVSILPQVSSRSMSNKGEDVLATSLFLKESFSKEALLAAALLAQEDGGIQTAASDNIYDEMIVSDVLSSGRAMSDNSPPPPPPPAPSSSASPVVINPLQKLTAPLTNMIKGQSQRTKRSIGFLTRLGACVMTFLSNPSCWQRLTRAQIQREQKRQLDLQQQQMEQQKAFLEQQIYQGYVNTLLYNSSTGNVNGTVTDGSSINGTALALAMQAHPAPTLPPFTTSTARPRLFPWAGRFRLFPRLSSFMENMSNSNGNSNSQNSDGRSSGYFMMPGTNANSQPLYRSLF